MTTIEQAMEQAMGKAMENLPRPAVTDLTRPFWQACRRHELIVPRCAGCTRCFFRPELACPHCGSMTWTWVPSSGLGTLYTYTVVHRASGPGVTVPYVLGAIDMREGFTMMSRVVDCPVEQLAFDMPLRLTFVDVDDEFSLPVFRQDQARRDDSERRDDGDQVRATTKYGDGGRRT